MIFKVIRVEVGRRKKKTVESGMEGLMYQHNGPAH